MLYIWFTIVWWCIGVVDQTLLWLPPPDEQNVVTPWPLGEAVSTARELGSRPAMDLNEKNPAYRAG